MTVGIEAVWPLFAVRIRSERLVLRLPRESDLVALIAVAKDGIHPEGEMPFGVARSTLPSPACETSFLQHHWGMWAGWSPQAWGLNLMVELGLPRQRGLQPRSRPSVATDGLDACLPMFRATPEAP